MALVTYIDHKGGAYEAEIENGDTVMQGAVDNMIDGIVAECGGCCSCATCHCYVEPEWLDKTGKPGDVEKELLECVPEPKSNSRLSCQIIISDELDGLVVRLPQSQY